jgi:hypothetical protein
MHPLRSALALVTTLAAPAGAHAQVNVATVLPRNREIELAITAAPILNGQSLRNSFSELAQKGSIDFAVEKWLERSGCSKYVTSKYLRC